MFRADLHCHTTCSDGTFSVEQLLKHAKEVGLAGISITDHDTTKAYETAPALAKQLGLALGSGVEFSTQFGTLSVHVLGYDFDLNDPGIEALCHRHRHRRQSRNRAILEKLAHHQMPLNEEELSLQGSLIGRPHIAQLMVAKGYVLSIQEAFQKYIGDEGNCFVRGEGITTEETLSILHGAGGKAFIAHPHLFRRGREVKNLLSLPFDGIECHYGNFTSNKEGPWIRLAKERGLLISGGSDFHGANKEYIALGASWVDEETFHKIFQKLL
ncbi:MAG: PHP domain-containing protein [Verrucomicrobia bacterium]|nr:PHP domain-containing protein [Verrucomicrobiota bacterium]